MIQQSIYSKVALNPTAAKFLIKQIRENCATEGIVQTMVITETQYASIEYVVGKSTSEVLNDMSRLVVL